jgi:hypothetical protein
MASSFTAQRAFTRPCRRPWRRVLAVLTSIALALSFLHDWGEWSFEDDAGSLTVAAVQMNGDGSGKAAPDWGAPHGDHCLAHATAVAPQASAVPIEYVSRPYGFAAALLPEGADPASPFEPPRA